MSHNYLNKDEYLHLAPTEPGTVRVHHCKQGRNNDRLYITRKEDDTILAYCHHCGLGGSHRVLGSRVLQAVEKSKANISALRSTDGRDGTHTVSDSNRRRSGGRSKDGGRQLSGLPTELTTRAALVAFADWSAPAKRWWLECGLTVGEAERYGVVYSHENQRLILPVVVAATVVGEVQKTFRPGEPKYLTVGQTDHEILVPVGGSANDELLLVEDLRSAYKCSRVINTLPLLGTNLSEKQLAMIMYLKPPKVYVFLDNDNTQVRSNAAKIKRRLSNVTDCAIIRYSHGDPKTLNESELKELLK